jgi:hypothetical protein
MNKKKIAIVGMLCIVLVGVYFWLHRQRISAIACYSLNRRICSGYSGPLLRVRRDSDGTELDVRQRGWRGWPFHSGDVDAVQLTLFCWRTTCSAVTIYNQVGGGNDMTGEQTLAWSLSGVVLMQSKSSR